MNWLRTFQKIDATYSKSQNPTKNTANETHRFIQNQTTSHKLVSHCHTEMKEIQRTKQMHRQSESHKMVHVSSKRLICKWDSQIYQIKLKPTLQIIHEMFLSPVFLQTISKCTLSGIFFAKEMYITNGVPWPPFPQNLETKCIGTWQDTKDYICSKATTGAPVSSSL